MPLNDFQKGVIATYMPSYTPYLQVPEINELLARALNEGWSGERIQAEVQNTTWWRTTPASARNALNLAVTDPATYLLDAFNRADRMRQSVLPTGVAVDPMKLVAYTQLGQFLGLNEQQIMERYVLYESPQSYSDAGVAGQLGDMTAQVQAKAGEWGVPVSQQTAYDLGRNVVAGRYDQAWIDDYMRDQARSVYSNNKSVLDAIDQGLTVKQFASPYMDMAAKELELNPADLSLMEEKWARPLRQVNENGESMTLYDWQRVLRKEPTYGYDQTTGARTQSAELQGGLLKKFGANA